MKRLFAIVMAALSFVAFSNYVFAGKPITSDNSELEAKLVSGVKALSSAITAVRPAHVVDYSRQRFRVVWEPAVTLKKGTSVEEQVALAQKLAQFVISFQGGEPTDDVLGGIIAFMEGDGWVTDLGLVSYQLENPSSPVEVWVSTNIVSDNGDLVCCDDIGKIGRIVNDKFQPGPTANVIAEIKKKISARGKGSQ